MNRQFSVLSLAILWSLATCQAQIEAPNEAGVALGQFHTIVRDVDASKKFWTTLGGKAVKIDGTDVVKFPGVYVFITKGSPSGGSYGSVVNHVGFFVPNHEETIARVQAAGVPAEYLRSQFGQHGFIGWAYSPDDLKVRINAEKTLAVPIGSPLVLFWVSKSAVPEMAAWYVKTFGGKPGRPINNGVSVLGIPGVRMNITGTADDPVGREPRSVGLVQGKLADSAFVEKLVRTGLGAPTKGRTLDYIGFEVSNLEAYCKKLEAGGIKFDQPYSKTRHKSFASAMLTDPWGVSIELTEGLRRF